MYSARSVVIVDGDPEEEATVVQITRSISPNALVVAATPSSITELQGHLRYAPKLVILDTEAAEMTPEELFARVAVVQALEKSPKIVMISVQNRDLVERCWNLGASAVLTKPEDPEGLRRVLVLTLGYWLVANLFPDYLYRS